MKLLITGGGFVGRSVIREYPELDITLMSRSWKPGQWIRGEVTAFRFPEANFTHIIHAPLFEPHFYKHEMEGFRRVQEFSRLCGAKLLYVSSGAAVDPTNDYGKYKLETEQLAKQDKIARLYAFVGPDLDKHYAIMNFIDDAMKKGKITVKGDGTNQRTWMWQGDMAKQLMSILEYGEPGKPYSVGSFESHTIKECADMVAEETGASVEVIGNPYGNSVYIPDYSEMFSMGIPYKPLRESIRLTIEALK